MSLATGFEGSYLGADAKISAAAVLECKICWTPYDPADGDETRQIPPGTPFVALPDDWHCPTCDAPKAQFMVLSDAAPVPAEPDPEAARLKAAVDRLVAEFREIHRVKMRDVPFCNAALTVEAVGFRPFKGRILGVLITPWFMNLMLLPGPADDWGALTPGAKELIAFPSGSYEFIHTVREGIGGYKACSLFSPMGDFGSQLHATNVAVAVMPALFDEAHREDTDRAGEIRRQRQEAMIPPSAAPDPPAGQPQPMHHSRRALLTGRAPGPDATP